MLSKITPAVQLNFIRLLAVMTFVLLLFTDVSQATRRQQFFSSAPSHHSMGDLDIRNFRYLDGGLDVEWVNVPPENERDLLLGEWVRDTRDIEIDLYQVDYIRSEQERRRAKFVSSGSKPSYVTSIEGILGKRGLKDLDKAVEVLSQFVFDIAHQYSEPFFASSVAKRRERACEENRMGDPAGEFVALIHSLASNLDEDETLRIHPYEPEMAFEGYERLPQEREGFFEVRAEAIETSIGKIQDYCSKTLTERVAPAEYRNAVRQAEFARVQILKFRDSIAMSGARVRGDRY